MTSTVSLFFLQVIRPFRPDKIVWLLWEDSPVLLLPSNSTSRAIIVSFVSPLEFAASLGETFVCCFFDMDIVGKL